MELGGGLTPSPPGNGWDCLFVGALPLPPPTNLPPLGAWLGKRVRGGNISEPVLHLLLLPLAFFPCQWHTLPAPSLALAKTRMLGEGGGK